MLTRSRQANHCYITAGYGAGDCGFPQSPISGIEVRSQALWSCEIRHLNHLKEKDIAKSVRLRLDWRGLNSKE